MTDNWADVEGRHDWLATDHSVDMPTRAEAEADAAITTTRDPNKRSCIGVWAMHTLEEQAACPHCNPFAPRCRWIDDVCEHGERIDDRLTTWDAATRRYICRHIYETRRA